MLDTLRNQSQLQTVLGEWALSWSVLARRRWAPRLCRAGSLCGQGWRDTRPLRWLCAQDTVLASVRPVGLGACCGFAADR